MNISINKNSDIIVTNSVGTSLNQRNESSTWVVGYTGHSQKTKHLEQPLTQTDHRSIHQSFDVVKTLERETLHGPSQISN